MDVESENKWHKNGNWGYRYRGWEAFNDHYLCNEEGHRFYGKKVVVKCGGQNCFDISEYKKTNASAQALGTETLNKEDAASK